MQKYHAINNKNNNGAHTVNNTDMLSGHLAVNQLRVGGPHLSGA